MDIKLSALQIAQNRSFGLMMCFTALTILFFIMYYITSYQYRRFLVIGIVSFVISVVFMGISASYTDPIAECRKSLNYIYYIDGNEVDLDKVDLALYHITYDDINRRAYMTGK